jgi:hypothetical protein
MMACAPVGELQAAVPSLLDAKRASRWLSIPHRIG